MTLIELLVAMMLTAMLLIGLVQLATAAGSATRLQDNQASLQDRARYVANLLSVAIQQAGFSPEPWNTALERLAIGPGTADGFSANSDRLVVTSWSDRNCFDNVNPERRSDGEPLFYFRESTFDLNSSKHLSRTCRYGASSTELVTQVRRQGLVPGVESFQCLFGEDVDADGHVDRWVQAGKWQDERQVIGVRVALLISGPDGVVPPSTKTYDVLDTRKTAPADGRLRELIGLTLAIRGRNG